MSESTASKEVRLGINSSYEKEARYVGWTPASCSISLPDNPAGQTQDLILRYRANEVHPDDPCGKIFFLTDPKVYQDYPESLSLQVVGPEEVNFFIAGRYGFPSYNDMDVMIDVYTVDSRTNQEERVAGVPLMVRVRRDANKLTSREQTRLVEAFFELSTEESYVEGVVSRFYDEVVNMHVVEAALEIHRRASFLPWHRIFILHVERELQRIDRAVTLPFWNWNKAAPHVFHENFIGRTDYFNDNRGDPTTYKTAVTFSEGHKWNDWYTKWGKLFRNYRFEDPAGDVLGRRRFRPEEEVINLASDYRGFYSAAEVNPHNPGHSVFGGLVVDIGKDPADPLFFLLHSNVDRLWAKWQKTYGLFHPTDPKTYNFQGPCPNERKVMTDKELQLGNYAEDTQWPWDWDYASPRPQNSDRVRVRMPDSPISSKPGQTPRALDVLDYQGHVDLDNYLGCDFEDVPFFERLAPPDLEIREKNRNSRAAAINFFFDPANSVNDRLGSIGGWNWIDDDFYQQAIDFIKDPANDVETGDIPKGTLRAAAVFASQFDALEYLELLISIVSDQTAPLALRESAIHTLRQSQRFSKHYFSIKPAFVNALKGVLQEQSPELFFAAAEILAPDHDADLQRKLKSFLEGRESLPISRLNAVRFLSMDSHGDFDTTFREVIDTSEDQREKAAAVIGLSANAKSSEFLLQILKNSQESDLVRDASASALRRQDPKNEEFNNALIEVAADTSLPESGLRTAMLSRINSSPLRSNLLEDPALQSLLSETSTGERLMRDNLSAASDSLAPDGEGNPFNFRAQLEKLKASAGR